MLTHEEQQTTEQTTEQAGAKPAHPVIPTTRAWQNWSRSIPPSNAQLETPADGDALLARINRPIMTRLPDRCVRLALVTAGRIWCRMTPA